jgi:hypothetical protein
MSEVTTNYELEKPLGSENYDVEVQNRNMNKLDTQIKTVDTKAVNAIPLSQKGVVGGVAAYDAVATSLADMSTQLATGTATAITLAITALTDLFTKTFIVSADNGGVATTINTKPLYKPNTVIAPNLTSGKAVTVWYDLASDCFFIKASATGNALVDDVLAEKTFSTEEDTDLVGVMVDRGTIVYMPGNSDQPILSGKHSGAGYVAGDTDLVASNFKNGVDIFGIIGAYNGKARVDFTSSGSWVATFTGPIDVFCVGGGGGYTTTRLALMVTQGVSYDIVIGYGGSGSYHDPSYGGASSFGGVVSAAGGQGGYYGNADMNPDGKGGNGGSGGGGGGEETAVSQTYSGNGGSNGGSGTSSNVVSGGSGQGGTYGTREFKEPAGITYSAGGGGGRGTRSDYSNSCTQGDDGIADSTVGFGGRGTSGGSISGNSGKVIIRWGY